MAPASVPAVPRWHRTGFRIALTMMLLLVVFGLGEILLFGVVSWLDARTLEGLFPGAELHRVHGIGFGIITWVLALSVLAQLWRPRERLAAAVLGLTALTTYTLAAIASGTFEGLELAGVAALAVMVWLHPARPGARFVPIRIPVIALGAPLLLGAAVFGGLQLSTQLSAVTSDPHAAFGHYGVMAALGGTLVAAVVIGASALPGSALSGWLAVAAALAFGLGSILFPASASSLGGLLGVGLVVAGLGLAAGLLLARGPREPAIELAAHHQEAT